MYLQVGSSFYKQNQIRVIYKANKTRKPTKLENKNKNKGKKIWKPIITYHIIVAASIKHSPKIVQGQSSS